jgi:RecA/RadA recombinase
MLGVKVEDLLISQPDAGEQALEIADTLVRSGAIDVLVVDSVAALTPRAEVRRRRGIGGSEAHGAKHSHQEPNRVSLHAPDRQQLMESCSKKVSGAGPASRGGDCGVGQGRDSVINPDASQFQPLPARPFRSWRTPLRTAEDLASLFCR